MALKDPTVEMLSQLKQQKFEVRIVSIEHIPDLENAIEQHHRQGLFSNDLYNEWIGKFEFTLPEDLPNAKSILVIAAPQPQFQVSFSWRTESHSAIIPPNYLCHSDRLAENILSRILGREKYTAANNLLPKKLLAVRSGLAKYGKNNLVYIPGMGSFHRLIIFYIDLPCPEHTWQEVQMAEECRECEACLRGCPTRAISSDRFLVYAERCISFYNERAGDFPEWIKPSMHNALVGCLYCQRVCPLNKPFIQWIEKKAEFSEEETRLLMEGAPQDQLAAATIKKIEELDCLEYLNVLGRNLSALLRKSGRL
jgi:epoxyqueuosine reductase